MKKACSGLGEKVYCGIDVGAETLSVAVLAGESGVKQREFRNVASGHQELIEWLVRSKASVRVSLEATGRYSLDLALALHGAPDVELAVLNPKVVNRFAQTLVRSQSDAAAAQVLAEYSRRMPFTAWVAPSLGRLELRTLARYIDALVGEQARDLNRLHALEASRTAPRAIVTDMKRGLASRARRIERMRGVARKMIAADAELEERFRLLVAMPGIGAISAIQLLGETVLLAAELTVRQWVAHSGLDPAHHDSGTSVHKRPRISRAGNRRLRRALFMPALAAARCDPHLKAFYQALQARHKTKLQALIAVARKLLHAIYGIFKNRTAYDGSKLFPQMKIVAQLQ
jgi:transposase